MNISRMGSTLFCLLLAASCQPRGGTASAAVGGGASAASQPSGPAPEIVIPADHFDAGKVKQGEIVKHTFVVQNRGLGTLNIEKVKGS